MGLQQDIDNQQEQMNKIVAERLADLKAANDTNFFIKKLLEGDRFTLDIISKHLVDWRTLISVIDKNVENYNKHVNEVSNRIQTLEKKAKYNHRMIGLILVIQLFLFIFDITINF
jgi:hypothetical protein